MYDSYNSLWADIHTHTPARKSSTNFCRVVYFLEQGYVMQSRQIQIEYAKNSAEQ